jgi:hypothetical protein
MQVFDAGERADLRLPFLYPAPGPPSERAIMKQVRYFVFCGRSPAAKKRGGIWYRSET